MSQFPPWVVLVNPTRSPTELSTVAQQDNEGNLTFDF
jgi:hypothetical protein